ncbi:MAG: DUF3526 domain-containing protein [Bacteroidota bacterium]
MQKKGVLLIAKQFWANTFKIKSVYLLFVIISMLFIYATYSGWKNYIVQNDIRLHFQEKVRQSWEENPDKHPHRMAHFGSFAFRLKHPLSMFDFGMESFTGNAVFLEAHKQNTVNFSEASFSTGLLRFGEISMAMVLQVILPLLIFFLGFASVASDKENGTLKIMLIQGVSWNEILLGRSLGLFGCALVFFFPIMLVTVFLLLLSKDNLFTQEVILRYIGICISYVIFYQVICMVTVWISATSKTSKDSLVKLLAIWLGFFILLPKTTQALGNYFFESPSKIEFEAAIEKELIQEGDSHDPDDPHFQALKDSLLQAHKVSSVEQLPFNYSGFVMREGEKISTAVYNRHLGKLFQTYQKQNNLSRLIAFINPYLAIKAISMSFSGSDFSAYVDFQKQAETYRYQLAQEMNELQIKYISNKKLGPNDVPYSISKKHWEEFPDFRHQFVSMGTIISREGSSIIALLVWSICSIGFIVSQSRKLKAI